MRANLKLIEDACQAHGARIHHDGQTQFAGTLGTAGCFSFYPGKNLGAWGEGGAVSTDDEELAAQIRTLRDHGRLSHYAHSAYGYTRASIRSRPRCCVRSSSASKIGTRSVGGLPLFIARLCPKKA